MTYRKLTPNPVTTIGSMASFVLGTIMVSTATIETIGQYVLGACLLLLGMVIFSYEISKL